MNGDVLGVTKWSWWMSRQVKNLKLPRSEIKQMTILHPQCLAFQQSQILYQNFCMSWTWNPFTNKKVTNRWPSSTHPIMPCQGGKEIKQPHLTWFYTIISSRPVVWLGIDLWIMWISKTDFTRKRPHHQWAKDSRGCCFHFPKPPPLKCVLPPAYERK